MFEANNSGACRLDEVPARSWEKGARDSWQSFEARELRRIDEVQVPQRRRITAQGYGGCCGGSGESRSEPRNELADEEALAELRGELKETVNS